LALPTPPQFPPGTHQAEGNQAAFVELVVPFRAPIEECVIEFESSGGSKMRIQWKATAPPDSACVAAVIGRPSRFPFCRA
jgi:hypothetical protein